MSTPLPRADAPAEPDAMLIGALLRVPAQAIHRRIVAGLNAAGFTELRLPHMAALGHPGPDGARPSALAERAGISRQAMNQLLRSLEANGYVERAGAPGRAGARTIRFTARGRAAYATILGILREIEREWAAELGAADFARLKALLLRVWDSPLVR